MSRKVLFDGSSFPVDEDLSITEAQDLLSEVYPAIADAEGSVDDQGDFVFKKKAGTKGC